MIKIGMEELEQARRLQEEAAKLHLPSPPVASFKISRRERNGEEKDLIHAKSNSYLRNAYNALTQDFTFASSAVISTSYFGDGVLSYESDTGGRVQIPPRNYSNLELQISLRLGTNGTPDRLDDTTLEEIPTNNWTGTLSRYSTFDESSRRFITLITLKMTNTSSATTYELRESGIYALTPSGRFLVIRDTFPAVTFAPGDNITFTYQLEVYYPSNN